jgi:hypothetical protein
MPNGRLIIVGDVHGCAEELRELLTIENFDQRLDTLVFVGDLVNKGPNTAEVLSIARSAGALAVRGNHEDELLEAWYQIGRYASGLHKYKNGTIYQISEADIKWIEELPLSISFPWLGLVVVHAGLVPGVQLCEQKFKDLLWLRDVRPTSNCRFEGLEMPLGGDASKPWASVWEGPEHVIFGHDAKRKLQTYKYATGLDSGCCYGFELTALVIDPYGIEPRRFVRVKAKKVHAMPKDKKVTEPKAAE